MRGRVIVRRVIQWGIGLFFFGLVVTLVPALISVRMSGPQPDPPGAEAYASVVSAARGTGVAAPGTPVMPKGVEGPFTVEKVTDGDTITVTKPSGPVTIRFIGVDTPETKDPRKGVQCWGKEASASTQTLIGGQQVYLETDPTQGETDKYGRSLAYVWTTSGVLVDYQLLSDGNGREYTYNNKPYKYQVTFKNAQLLAKDAKKGLWSPSTCNGGR